MQQKEQPQSQSQPQGLMWQMPRESQMQVQVQVREPEQPLRCSPAQHRLGQTPLTQQQVPARQHRRLQRLQRRRRHCFGRASWPLDPCEAWRLAAVWAQRQPPQQRLAGVH